MTKKLLNEQIKLLEDLTSEQFSESKVIENLKAELNRFQAIAGFSRVINSSSSFMTVERMAMEKLKKLLNCEHVLVFRVDRETHELYSSKNCSKEEFRFKIDDHSLPGSSAFHVASLHVSSLHDDLRFRRFPFLKEEGKAKDALFTPMAVDGDVLGVLVALNSKRGEGFDDDDVELLELLGSQLSVSFHNEKLYADMKEQFYQICEALVDAIGIRDSYTGGHTKRVERYSRAIGRELNLSKAEMDELRLAALLHDIGKIGIEDRILKKEAPLDHDEFLIMQQHPRMGHEILAHIDGLKNVTDGMRFHHERPDGKGYPYGLKRDEIPLLARIISVADTYDAMVSNRPYRKGLSPMTAFNEIYRCMNTQFDEAVAKAFIRFFKKTSWYVEEEDLYLEEELVKKAS